MFDGSPSRIFSRRSLRTLRNTNFLRLLVPTVESVQILWSQLERNLSMVEIVAPLFVWLIFPFVCRRKAEKVKMEIHFLCSTAPLSFHIMPSWIKSMWCTLWMNYDSWLPTVEDIFLSPAIFLHFFFCTFLLLSPAESKTFFLAKLSFSIRNFLKFSSGCKFCGEDEN